MLSKDRSPRIPGVAKAREASTRYKDFLDAEEARGYRVVPIRPPEIWANGERLNLEATLGGHIPPTLEHGRAIQAVTELEKLENVILDPVAFTFYSVTPIASSVRPGRVKTVPEAMNKAFRNHDYLKTGLIGATRSTGNYWHWLVESMPRVMRLRDEFPDEEIVVQRKRLPFHDLKANFPQLTINSRELMRSAFLEEAIVPSLTTRFAPDPSLSKHMITSEDVLMFPRAVQQPSTKTRRLFLSRRDVNTRVLHDEERLCQDLERRGFDIVVMGELTGAEQASICSEAEIIISTHGAGLANMLFRVDRACTIIEVVPVRHWPHTNLVSMFNLSTLAGFRHIVYDCSYEHEDVRLLSQNWAVDINAFLSFIDNLKID